MGHIRKLVLFFLAIWIAIAFDIYLVAFLFFGWAAVFLKASPRDLVEHLDFLSTPLGWASPAFLIRPDKSYVQVVGIIFLNSYFYALVLFPAIRVTRSILQRSKPIKIDLSDRKADDED